MPSWFTQNLCDGKEESFRTFALRCARGMAACYMQREEDINLPPRAQKPDDYHRKELREAKEKLKKILAMTDDEALARSREEEYKANQLNQEHIKKTSEIRDRIDKMRKKVVAWTPPTKGHRDFKEFMLNQLQFATSIEGSTNDFFGKMILHLSGPEWKAKEIKSIKEDIAYHSYKYREHLKGIKECNKWIQDLYKSLDK